METIDLKKVAKFYPDRISREMLKDSRRCASPSCAEPGPETRSAQGPLRLLMYCVEAKALSPG